MKFKRTYKIIETGYQRDIYYYIDNKRVSSEKFYDTKYMCQRAGMKYNASALYRNVTNGRTVDVCYYD